MPDPKLDSLLAYLRENGARYAMPDLRAHLLSQGWPVESVDTAIAHYQEEHGGSQPAMFGTVAQVSASPGPLAITLVVLAIFAGVGLMLVGTCFGIVGVLGMSSMNSNDVWMVAGATVAFVFGLLLVILPIQRLRRSRRR
jgi:hypothetical protein